MRVALLVRERVMPAMCRTPVDQRPLQRHRTGDRESDLQGTGRLETLVGKQTVVADRHAETGEPVEADRDGSVHHAQAMPPEGDERQEEPEERKDRGDENGATLPFRAVVVERLDAGDVHMTG